MQILCSFYILLMLYYLQYNYLLKGIIMLFKTNERAQGLVEYALILVFIAIVVIAALTVFGPQLGDLFSRVTNQLGVL
jgi:pilus assembly protein Flp/PilA